MSVTPDVEQMREELSTEPPMREKHQPLLNNEDLTIEEEYPTYAQDSQKYMHWHYGLNHETHTVMTKMARQNKLPKKILTAMDKQHVKPPMYNDYCGAKAIKRPLEK